MKDMLDFAAKEIYAELLVRFPSLRSCGDEIWSAYEMIAATYRSGGKLLAVGNGGSAADAEHMVGELMKSFNFKRTVENGFAQKMALMFGEQGETLASVLEGALPAMSLPSLMSLSTAYINDAQPQAVFAQMVYGIGKPGDVLFAISTSGNSPNIVYACMAAKARGLKTIGLSGQTGGKLKGLCDVTICVPSERTFVIQEYHLPVYHALCAMLEADFFGKGKS